MCGIFGFTGKQNASPILLDGLSCLEYRGYDSAGIFMPQNGVSKAAGPVQNLKDKLSNQLVGTSGIAHLRWATHGEPTELNAHPHSDCSGDIWLVHNGIIENYKAIKNMLADAGHSFVSATDTEVLAHLIEHYLKESGNFETAVLSALNQVRGTYGIAVMNKQEPEKIIAARMGAPVVLGLGTDENFIASDPSPILRHTKNVIYLRDGEVAVITPSSHRVFSLDNQHIEASVETLEWDAEQIKKDGFESFMLKEIMEAPEVIKNSMRGRLLTKLGSVKLGGIEAVTEKLRNINRIIIVGCGTAYYAGLTGEYMFEECAGIPTEVEVGSEFRYRRPIIDAKTMLLAISQSGETADTLEAIREAKRKGALTIGIVNAVGSTIARETDAGIYNHAGPEIGVASTKAFISQLTVLALLTLFLGRQRNMTLSAGKAIAEELARLPEKIKTILTQGEKIQELAKRYTTVRDFLYIGRKYNYSIAFEGALKLKEVSYIHAEGYGAGEMKHGPLAMIDEHFPTIAIVPQDSVYEKVISNIQEIKARKGPVIAIATLGDEEIGQLADDIIFVPKTIEMLEPILTTIPLQLFAYYMARERGFDVDKPRNLAKSVTVE